jgi:NAD(P)-dependent dehydrogenase (short-subunit alcohol dehydrogenase family)
LTSLQAKLPQITAIVCNAFAWSLNSGLQYSQDGMENTMAINHIGHFTLILRLLSDMVKSGRIVVLSSITHWPGKTPLEKFPPVLPENLDLLVHPPPDKPGEEVGRGYQPYGFSKLVLIISMYELQRKLKQVSQDSPLPIAPPGQLNS